jgi:hypothetical protein
MEKKSNLDDFNVNKKYVNGPVNIVRMEGNINGINKVIYLFMDGLLPIINQTECDNIYSTDIDRFLAESFHQLHNNKKMYDFFVHISTYDIVYPKEPEYFNRKYIYILNVIKFFQKIFSYNIKKDKVEISDVFKNVRLHYTDISHYFTNRIFPIIRHLRSDGEEIIIKGNIEINFLQHVNSVLNETKLEIEKTIETFRKEEQTPTKKTVFTKDVDEIIISRFVHKIKHKYRHKNVKKIINDLFVKYVGEINELVKFIDYTGGVINDYGNYIYNDIGRFTIYKHTIPLGDGHHKNIRYYYPETDTITMRKIMIKIANLCELVHNLTDVIFSKIINLYFLRRFLDKDYITNAIVYATHTAASDYILNLVSIFHFRITHVHYSTFKNMKDLEKEIRKRKELDEDCGDIFLPNEIYQCVELSHFPTNFS